MTTLAASLIQVMHKQQQQQHLSQAHRSNKDQASNGQLCLVPVTTLHTFSSDQ